jgi:diacylglycerol O-acyltransferase / wax synthase
VDAQPLDWDRLRDVMDERVTGRYPVFRSLAVHEPDGSWWWEESPDYDLDNHVQMVKLDDPSDPRSLQQLVADNRTRMLDRSKPLWEAMWVEEYLEGSAVVLRSHHAIADGVRMVELAMTMFEAGPDGGSVLSPGITHHAAKAAKVAGDSAGRPSRGAHAHSPASASSPPTPGDRRGPCWPASLGRPAKQHDSRGRRSSTRSEPGTASSPRAPTRPTTRALGARAMQAVLPGGGVINVLAAAPSDLDVARKLVLGTRNDPTIWTGHATTNKGVAWADPLVLADVRALAKANEATINDVLVSCLAGSLERYLRSHDVHCASTTFMVPVNLKPLNTGLPDELGNAFALIYLELPTASRTR